MKLSTRSTYGMRAMVELGLVARRGPLSVALIAKQQDLSVAYLEQLLHRLKKRGLVTSVRGPKGGYLLAKEPDQIPISDIVLSLDGAPVMPNGKNRVSRHLTPNGASGAKSGTGKQTARHAQQIAHAVYRCVHERLAKALDAVTLQDLCDEVRESAQDPLDHRYVFHI